MKTSFTLLAGIFGLVMLSPVAAQTYQWKDASGRTIISDSPPPGNARSTRSVTTAPAEPTADTKGNAKTDAKGDETPKSTAEKNMEFKKRQQEAKEKQEKADKEAAANAARKENCESAKRQLAALESGQRMATMDEKGERRFLEDAERQKETERARQVMAESCK